MYHLLFDDDVYANMVQGAYDASQWMSIGDVRATATQLERSAKKFDELCRKGALLRGDVLSMERNGSDGITVSFSASIEDIQHNVPLMRTMSSAGSPSWSCKGPTEFQKEMIRVFPNVQKMRDGLWDIVTVTRNGQDLGNLYEIRQCLELWEQEMEKWGCNGLGEKLGDKLTSR